MMAAATTTGERRASLRGWATDFAVATGVGAFLGLVGPFGSFFNGPPWQRIVYWTAMSWTGLLVYGLGLRLIHARLRSPRSRWTAAAVMAVCVAAPFGVFSWILATSLWPGLQRLPALTPAVWYGEVLILTAPQVGFFAAREERRRAAAAVAARRSPPPTEGLLGVAPAEVLCLQMEDHYVRVHTAHGSRLVLATLVQGVEALGRTPGLHVHRSWWVAHKAVAGAAAEGRNLRLQLTNGVSAPVARSAVAAVRAAGWLQDATSRPPLDAEDRQSAGGRCGERELNPGNG